MWIWAVWGVCVWIWAVWGVCAYGQCRVCVRMSSVGCVCAYGQCGMCVRISSVGVCVECACQMRVQCVQCTSRVWFMIHPLTKKYASRLETSHYILIHAGAYEHREHGGS